MMTELVVSSELSVSRLEAVSLLVRPLSDAGREGCLGGDLRNPDLPEDCADGRDMFAT